MSGSESGFSGLLAGSSSRHASLSCGCPYPCQSVTGLPGPTVAASWPPGRRACSLDPASPAYLRSYGQALRNCGQHEAAIQVLGSLLQLQADDEAALQARGFCLRKVGSYAAAAADYGRLISLGQASVRNFNSRAYCCASLGKYSEAVADYTAALKVGGWNVTNVLRMVSREAVPLFESAN